LGQGLGETGYVENTNVTIEYRWADGDYDRLPAMAADLVRRQVNVIAATGGSPSSLAAKAATASIPIVFQIGIDPINAGLVTSLSQPDANITGATMLATELGPKRLELLHELLPSATNFAMLVNPTGPGAAIQITDVQEGARRLGLQVQFQKASSVRDFESVFANMVKLRVNALVIGADPLFNIHSSQLAALTIHNAIPTIYQFREFSEAGGLMSYGGSLADAYRVAGVYTGRILNGEKPADLPVQQSTKIELIVNLKTANTLGVTIPPTLLARADEVIE
jgi:putative ABC transport system substrate-binding protein